MSQIFDLSASLTLDTADFIRSIRNAETAARQLQSTLDSRMSAAAASMGRLQTSASGAWSSIVSGIQQAIDKTREFLSLGTGQPSGAMQGFATGLGYVPYDNYPAYLHEGEAVLTKMEANDWRKGGTPATVDTAAIATAVSSALSGFSVYMDGQKVGNLITDTVSRNIAQSAHAGRYA